MNRLITVIFAILSAVTVSAQHEFSVYAGGGLSSLNYQIDAGTQKGGLGAHFGLGYRYELDRNWGVLTGIGMGIFNSTFTSTEEFTSENQATDNFNANAPVLFTYKSVVRGYEEKQVASLLQIPLMAQYVYNFSTMDAFVNAGLKFGLPLSGNYSSNVKQITNTGVYPNEYEYSVQQFRGFGVYNDKPYNGDLNFKLAVMFSIEAGTKFELGNDLSLYVGAFVDIGLNNIHKSVAPHFVEYVEYLDHVADFRLNSVIHSQYENFTEKIVPVAAGIKLALAIQR